MFTLPNDASDTTKRQKCSRQVLVCLVEMAALQPGRVSECFMVVITTTDLVMLILALLNAIMLLSSPPDNPCITKY